ncbi:unnamed protein product [Ectocarpus sp. 12 AP-2014]
MHYLCCIINVVDEELYRVFVKEREKSNTVALTYPTEIHKISTARGKVLYYIAGWLLSKAWSRKRRHNIPDQEWDFIVQHNHSPSSAGAIERDPILQDMVGEVDARNDPVNGAGLLFPTLAWYEFVFHVENGIYHFLRDPYFLGTYPGDLSAEILRVVTESSEVRRAWAKCCPSAVAPPPFEAQPEILDDIYKFVLQKFHNVRMGDFARRLSQNSTLRLSKGELALRQNLRATSAKGEATAKGVAPVGGGIDGTSQLAGGVVAGSGTVTNEGLAVETVRKMTKPQLFELTKGTLVDLIKAGGGDAKVWRKKEFLVNALLSVVGGSKEDGEGGRVDHVSGNGPVDVAGDGGDSEISNVRVNQVSSTGGEGLEWIDALPLEDADMSNLLQELALGGGVNDASLGDFDEDFLGRSIDFEEVFPSSPKTSLAGAHGPT